PPTRAPCRQAHCAYSLHSCYLPRTALATQREGPFPPRLDYLVPCGVDRRIQRGRAACRPAHRLPTRTFRLDPRSRKGRTPRALRGTRLPFLLYLRESGADPSPASCLPSHSIL